MKRRGISGNKIKKCGFLCRYKIWYINIKPRNVPETKTSEKMKETNIDNSSFASSMPSIKKKTTKVLNVTGSCLIYPKAGSYFQTKKPIITKQKIPNIILIAD